MKLGGVLHYTDAAAAEAAYAAMALARGARVEGATIVFDFDGALPSGDASDVLSKALESAIAGSVIATSEEGARRVFHALGPEYWAKRWRDGRTGWHEGAANELFVQNVARIEANKPARVLVPLAGKSADLRWLAERGHEVVGVEVVVEGARAFFTDRGVDPAVTKMGRASALSAEGVTIVCSDFFDVSPDDVGRFDVIYDRAALVAIEPSMRARYLSTCSALLRDGGRTFLVAVTYREGARPGPPWHIDEAAVRALYAGRTVERLGSRSLPAFVETAYVIS